MYENENYAGDSTGKTDSNVSPYFDYTSHAAAEPVPDSGKVKKVKQKKAHGSGVFKKLILSICLGLCFGACAALGFYAVQLGTGQLGTSQITQNEEPAEKEKEKDQEALSVQAQPLPYENVGTTRHITYVQTDLSEMVEDVMPAMVSIVNNYTTRERDFWGQTYIKPGVSSGSGIIVGETDKELLIATNNHVVEDATSLEITFIDGSKAEAVIKGTDADMDLAVVAVPLSDLTEDTRNAITVARLGDSDNLKLGEPVIAIGNALGYGQSVTDGIVSALNREIEVEDGSTGTFIQTNAAINPGNSGGALLNLNGDVIGINSNKIGGSAIEGMGYAIPISAAEPILSELMERETRIKVDAEDMGYMGIEMQTISKDISKAYGWPQGVSIMEVTEGSAAEAAGILKGDIVVKFDGQRISLATDLQDILQYYKAGETVEITVMRLIDGEYESLELEITLGRKPRNKR